jgi:hypothetical protein
MSRFRPVYYLRDTIFKRTDSSVGIQRVPGSSIYNCFIESLKSCAFAVMKLTVDRSICFTVLPLSSGISENAVCYFSLNERRSAQCTVVYDFATYILQFDCKELVNKTIISWNIENCCPGV